MCQQHCCCLRGNKWATEAFCLLFPTKKTVHYSLNILFHVPVEDKNHCDIIFTSLSTLQHFICISGLQIKDTYPYLNSVLHSVSQKHKKRVISWIHFNLKYAVIDYDVLLLFDLSTTAKCTNNMNTKTPRMLNTCVAQSLETVFKGLFEDFSADRGRRMQGNDLDSTSIWLRS